MVFSSTVFLFAFLPVVLLVHFALPGALRNAWLLLASLFFYAWGEQEVVLVMLASIAWNHGAGLLLERTRGTGRARWILGLAIAGNLAVLVVYKYLGFLGANLSRLAEAFGGAGLAVPDVALPIGISFFTFQGMSYVVDVFRGDVTAERRIVPFGMYIALFPQLVAGPIVRYREIAREIAARTIRRATFAAGVRRFTIGLGKKMLVANTVAVAADHVFALPPGEMGAGLAWVGLVAYSIQIYFDFSGYSDMAIGLGMMLGFTFPENFAHPYVARSVTEFWRRWHLTLSRWFRDYLYVPLGGNRIGRARTVLNLWIVFLLCGLWHGDQWTFIVWGALHGLFLVVERSGLGALLERAPRPARHAYLLLAVMIAWVFFRAETLEHALAYLGALVGAGGDPALHPVRSVASPNVLLALVAGAIGATPVVPWAVARIRARDADGGPLRAAAVEAAGVLVLVAVLLLSAMQLAAGTHNPFIYFRF